MVNVQRTEIECIPITNADMVSSRSDLGILRCVTNEGVSEIENAITHVTIVTPANAIVATYLLETGV